MSTVISIADFRRRENLAARVRDHTRPFCAPCYDQTGDVFDLIAHKIWGADRAYSCPNCGSEFDDDC